MEKDILLDGIIEYTKSNKLNWYIIYEREMSTYFETKLEITNNKVIIIKFHCNYKKPAISDISITINKIDRISQYKYITSYDLKQNRLKELADNINNQLNSK